MVSLTSQASCRAQPNSTHHKSSATTKTILSILEYDLFEDLSEDFEHELKKDIDLWFGALGGWK